MTTRTFTPRPAQPAAKTTATGAMDGWRIEVDAGFDGFDDGDEAGFYRPSGETVWLRVYEFVLSPARVVDGVEVAAAAVDPLFETIYVSRALEGDEPDTLRRLMAEECGRERERERHPLLMIGSETRGVFFETQADFAASKSLWSNSASAPLSLEGLTEAMRKLEMRDALKEMDRHWLERGSPPGEAMPCDKQGGKYDTYCPLPAGHSGACDWDDQ